MSEHLQRAYEEGAVRALAEVGLGLRTKVAGRALNRFLKVIPYDEFGRTKWKAVLELPNKKPQVIGEVMHNPVTNNVDMVEVHPEMRGMGIMKKMYGEIMRQSPKGELFSGNSYYGPKPLRALGRMSRDPSYDIENVAPLRMGRRGHHPDLPVAEADSLAEVSDLRNRGYEFDYATHAGGPAYKYKLNVPDHVIQPSVPTKKGKRLQMDTEVSVER